MVETNPIHSLLLVYIFLKSWRKRFKMLILSIVQLENEEEGIAIIFLFLTSFSHTVNVTNNASCCLN